MPLDILWVEFWTKIMNATKGYYKLTNFFGNSKVVYY